MKIYRVTRDRGLIRIADRRRLAALVRQSRVSSPKIIKIEEAETGEFRDVTGEYESMIR